MNHVFMKNTPIHAGKEELYHILLNSINDNKLICDEKRINEAYEIACLAHKGKVRYSNDAYVTHSMNVAILLAEMSANEEVILAGLLNNINLEEMNTHIKDKGYAFPDKVFNILQDLSNFNVDSEATEEVVMIKIAERLHNMRTIEFMDENRWREKAKETLEIFLPIAVKLNNEKMIAELKDLSIKYI